MKTTKVLSFAVAMFAIAGLMVAFNNQEAYARPPLAGVGDHVMKINLIGVPNGTDRNCDSGSSKNIYTPIGTDDGGKVKENIRHQHILWAPNTGTNAVTDHCTEGVGDAADEAQVELDGGDYKFTIRILGPANNGGNFFKYCSELISVHDSTEAAGEYDCVVDGSTVPDTVVSRGGGSPSYTIPKTLFEDPDNEGQVWSTATGSGFKIAQIDIWEAPVA